MICSHREVSSLDKVSEVFYGEVHCQKFTVKSAVTGLGGGGGGGASFLEKYAIGCQTPSTCCCNTAPTAVSEASDMMQVGENGLG